MGSTLHPVDHLRERAHLCPIGKVDRIPAVGWAAGYPHNEADDLPVEEAVTGIVDFSRKHSQLPGSPCQALQEFDHVGIGVGMAFFRFAGDQIDGEKRVRPRSEYRSVAGTRPARGDACRNEYWHPPQFCRTTAGRDTALSASATTATRCPCDSSNACR